MAGTSPAMTSTKIIVNGAQGVKILDAFRLGSQGDVCIVIPGWSEGPDPESRDSGFDAAHRPGMTEETVDCVHLRDPPVRRTCRRLRVRSRRVRHRADGVGDLALCAAAFAGRAAG